MAFGSPHSGTIGAALAFGVASMAGADSLICTATTQCRGDADRMCAASTLEIAVKPGGGSGTQLWIDHQGPYAARARREDDMHHYELAAFGGRYRLDIAPDGQFLYTGNRGKRFSGTCEEKS